jgi:FixJ family two-component response regulator
MLRASGHAVKNFSSASDFLAKLTPESSGCVIADLSMPGLSGLDLQDVLSRSGDSMPVIFLTGHGDIPSTVRAMRHGAEDFLTKCASKQEVLAAVQRALDRNSRERAKRAHLREMRAQLDMLTPREREVLDRVIMGKLNKEIAAELNIHERTVKAHRTSTTTKLGVHSAAELTRLVLEADGAVQSREASL